MVVVGAVRCAVGVVYSVVVGVGVIGCHRGENMSSDMAAVATLPESVRNQVG